MEDNNIYIKLVEVADTLQAHDITTAFAWSRSATRTLPGWTLLVPDIVGEGFLGVRVIVNAPMTLDGDPDLEGLFATAGKVQSVLPSMGLWRFHLATKKKPIPRLVANLALP